MSVRRTEWPRHGLQLVGPGAALGRCEIDHSDGHRFFWAGAPLQLELRRRWRLFSQGMRLCRGTQLLLESNYPPWQRRSVLDLVVHLPQQAPLPLVAFMALTQIAVGF